MPQAVHDFIHKAEARDRVLGIRIPVAEENGDEPWRQTIPQRRSPERVKEPLPDRVKIVLSDDIYIDRYGASTSYGRSAHSIGGISESRVLSGTRQCAYRHLASRESSLARRCIGIMWRCPRGCLEETLELLRTHGIEAEIEDLRERGAKNRLPLSGYPSNDQRSAFDALSRHDCGVLAATTAFGKTIVAAALIAHRQINTLVLVHRKELLKQWVERLQQFLSVDTGDVGTTGGGRRKPTGRIDVALIQSLVRKAEVSDQVAGYGHLIVDECHHLSAFSFELVARRSKARYVLGLSATVTRKDGHHPIIFMQCGPVRHRVTLSPKPCGAASITRSAFATPDFRLPPELEGSPMSMPAIYSALGCDEARNAVIFDDVLTALEAAGVALILTERRDHLETLRGHFERFTRNLVVLHGGMYPGTSYLMQAGAGVWRKWERLVLATGRYLGEGFDDSRLDTLFLVMPLMGRDTGTIRRSPAS